MALPIPQIDPPSPDKLWDWGMGVLLVAWSWLANQVRMGREHRRLLAERVDKLEYAEEEHARQIQALARQVRTIADDVKKGLDRANDRLDDIFMMVGGRTPGH